MGPYTTSIYATNVMNPLLEPLVGTGEISLESDLLEPIVGAGEMMGK